MSEKITPEIMSYISEIAEKMKNGRASLMIGAGLSKNAVPNMPTNKKFLTWNELGDFFMKNSITKSLEITKDISMY